MNPFKSKIVPERHCKAMQSCFLFIPLSIVGILAILFLIRKTESFSTVQIMLVFSGLIGVIVFFVAGAQNKDKILMAAFLLALPISMGKMIVENHESTKSTATYLLQVYLSDILLFMFIVVWFVNFYSNRHRSGIPFWQKQNKLLIPLLLWIGMGFISLIPAIDRTAAIVGVVQMLRILVTFFAVFHFIKGRKEVYFVLNCLLIALFLQAVLMFAQYTTNSLVVSFAGSTMGIDEVSAGFRPVGTMGHSSHFAKFSGLMLPIALAYIFFAPGVRNKFFFLSIWICGSVALAMTLSRAGLATWLFTPIFFIAGLIKLNLISARRIITLLAGFIILIGISTCILYQIAGERLEDRMAFDNDSSKVRLPMFKVALNVIKAHPLTGVGLKNYTLVHQDYDNTRYHISAVLSDTYVHNLFLLYAAEIGIPGLLFFLWFIWDLLKGSLRCASHIVVPLDKTIYLGVAIGVTNILLQSMTGMGVVTHLIHLSTIAIFAAIVVKQGLTLSNLPRETMPIPFSKLV